MESSDVVRTIFTVSPPVGPRNSVVCAEVTTLVIMVFLSRQCGDIQT